MKKLLLFLPLLLFSGFNYSEEYTPILMDRSELESSIQYVDSSLSLIDPGRMCLFQHWVLLVDLYKGVHIIDNTDPAHPQRVGFLRVPGCQSLAVGNGVLYVDNSVDLVGIRFHPETGQVEEIARTKKVLPEINSPLGYIPYAYRRYNRPANTEIVGWVSNYEAL
jgi:hypothetical protein